MTGTASNVTFGHTGPDLSRMEERHEYEVTYTSRRSGNEITRSGEVTTIAATDSGRAVWIHEERRGPLKHQFVALGDTEGDDIAAFSVPVGADPPCPDKPPRVGRPYTVRFSAGRTMYLGRVERIRVVTDG